MMKKQIVLLIRDDSLMYPTGKLGEVREIDANGVVKSVRMKPAAGTVANIISQVPEDVRTEPVRDSLIDALNGNGLSQLVP